MCPLAATASPFLSFITIIGNTLMRRTHYRNRVMVMLFLLSTITFIDRVCIALAGPRIITELHLLPSQWGWVMGAFAIPYAIFEIPSGILGDLIGPRKLL